MSMLREAPVDGKPGPVSMRRVSAGYLFVAAVALGVVGAVFGVPWQGIAALVGIPVTAGVLLLLFTTWTDIRGIIESAKGGGE